MTQSVNVGERVGCISHTKERTAFIFGFGKYLGRRIPRDAGGIFGQALVEAADVVLAESKAKLSDEEYKKVEERVTEMHGNPCFELDNGKIAYGCECWWASEAQVKEQLARFDKVEVIDLDAARKGEHVVVTP